MHCLLLYVQTICKQLILTSHLLEQKCKVFVNITVVFPGNRKINFTVATPTDKNYA